MAETGLTRNQVKAGIREINRIKQLRTSSRSWSTRTVGPMSCRSSYKDLLPWTYNRLTDMKTRLVTEKAARRRAGQVAQWKCPATSRNDVDRLIEDLSDLIDTLG